MCVSVMCMYLCGYCVCIYLCLVYVYVCVRAWIIMVWIFQLLFTYLSNVRNYDNFVGTFHLSSSQSVQYFLGLWLSRLSLAVLCTFSFMVLYLVLLKLDFFRCHIGNENYCALLFFTYVIWCTLNLHSLCGYFASVTKLQNKVTPSPGIRAITILSVKF